MKSVWKGIGRQDKTVIARRNRGASPSSLNCYRELPLVCILCVPDGRGSAECNNSQNCVCKYLQKPSPDHLNLLVQSVLNFETIYCLQCARPRTLSVNSLIHEHLGGGNKIVDILVDKLCR